jgi:molybdate transport system regulatory protein
MTGRREPIIPPFQARFKLWIETASGEGAFGEGKWRLLDAIARTGSLSAAAGELGISYRKAWGDLRKAELYCGMTFLERRRGGQHGGESSLTPDGKRWLRAYQSFSEQIEQGVNEAFQSWRGAIAESDSSGGKSLRKRRPIRPSTS